MVHTVATGTEATDSAVADPRAATSSVRDLRLLALTLLLALLAAAATGAQGEGTLRVRIRSGQAREHELAGAAARLGELQRKAAREVAILETRLAAVQEELNTAQADLQATQAKLDQARERVKRLRARLAEVRVKLAGLLKARYMGGEPDFVTVVL